LKIIKKYCIIYMGDIMAVKLNEDKAVVERIREGLKKKGGYCPCRLGNEPENKCICEEFRQQIADPDFEGYCHCMLYYKEK
jgi:ferredoxin-thioredoxin reductase catalytic subunit